MSTQINVTVDSAGLAERARQQQEAARLAQLEKERTLNLSAAAFAQRVAAQAAKGLTIDGQPLYGTNTRLPPIDRRSAAAPRQRLVAILLVPLEPFTELGIAATTKNLPPPQVFELGADLPATIVDNGGPDGKPAILSTASLGTISSQLYAGYLGVFTEPTFFKITSRTWTFEGYLRLGDFNTSATMEYDGYRITLYWDYPPGSAVPPVPAFEFIVPGADHLASVDYLDPSANPAALNRYSYTDQLVPAVGQWIHFAIVQEPTQYKIFLDGQILSTIIPEPDQSNAYYGYINSVDYAARGNYKLFDNLGQNDPPESVVKPGVHGYRFTAGKALYTETFTPPASITGFA